MRSTIPEWNNWDISYLSILIISNGSWYGTVPSFGKCKYTRLQTVYEWVNNHFHNLTKIFNGTISKYFNLLL